MGISSSIGTLFFTILCIYLFLAMLGLHCCSGFSLVVASGGYPLVAVLRLLIAVAFLVAEHGHVLGHVGLQELQHVGSWA